MNYKSHKNHKNLEKSSNQRESCINDDTSLSNDEKEAVKLQLPDLIIPELLHPEHPNKDGKACKTVEEQFRDGSNLNSNVLHLGICVGDEDKEDNERDDGDYKNEDSTEHASIGMAAINAVMLASFLNHRVF